MGLGWAIVAFFLPGIPQLLHLDLVKVAVIWLLPAATFLVAGPVAMIIGVIVHIYNLGTALDY